ncbi:MAG: iron ABC transporter permease [Blautia sp.]|nr:iron ABC transporter permease [Blautia sp.]
MGKVSRLMKNHVGITCVILSICLILSIVLCVGIGPVSIPFSTVWKIIFNKITGWGNIASIENKTINIVWFLRVPRVLLSTLVGVCLSISGVSMQAFTRNPLASPYVLGTSSGASFGAALAIATGALSFLGISATSIGAFTGALLSIVIVYGLAKSGEEVAPIRLVLVGSAVSAMFTAFSNFIVYKAPDDSKVKAVTFWMLGSVATAEWSDILPIFIVMVPGVVIMFALSSSLNAMLIGESSAVTLGVNVNRVRKVTIFISALMTGVTVAVSGCIGFVGLVVPHIVRSLVGADHRKVIPISVLAGAIFMIWVDVGARMIDAPGEIPIGIITSMIGAPLFLWMLKSRKYTFGN